MEAGTAIAGRGATLAVEGGIRCCWKNELANMWTGGRSMEVGGVGQPGGKTSGKGCDGGRRPERAKIQRGVQIRAVGTKTEGRPASRRS